MSTEAREGEYGDELRRLAEEAHEVAAEHRARAHELRAGAAAVEAEAVDSDAYLHAGIAEVLAEVADLRAAGAEARAVARDVVTRAESAPADAREELLKEAGEAVQRADRLEQRSADLRDSLQTDPALHEARAEAAIERARARQPEASERKASERRNLTAAADQGALERGVAGELEPEAEAGAESA